MRLLNNIIVVSALFFSAGTAFADSSRQSQESRGIGTILMCKIASLQAYANCCKEYGCNTQAIIDMCVYKSVNFFGICSAVFDGRELPSEDWSIPSEDNLTNEDESEELK